MWKTRNSQFIALSCVLFGEKVCQEAAVILLCSSSFEQDSKSCSWGGQIFAVDLQVMSRNGLHSVDSDVLAPAKGGNSFHKPWGHTSPNVPYTRTGTSGHESSLGQDLLIVSRFDFCRMNLLHRVFVAAVYQELYFKIQQFHRHAAIQGKSLKSSTLAGFWATKLDLKDDIDPLDIEICKKPNGEEWKLGEGAFGTVPSPHLTAEPTYLLTVHLSLTKAIICKDH